MPDPVDRPESAHADCSRGGSIQSRAVCIVASLAQQYPDRVTTFDLWRPQEIFAGDGQNGTVHFRIAEEVRVVTNQRRDRFYQDAAHIAEQKVERAVIVPVVGLEAQDILVRNRDGVAFDVMDVVVNEGVESLTIQKRQRLFTEPPPSRGTLRMAFVGAQIQ